MRMYLPTDNFYILCLMIVSIAYLNAVSRIRLIFCAWIRTSFENCLYINGRVPFSILVSSLRFHSVLSNWLGIFLILAHFQRLRWMSVLIGTFSLIRMYIYFSFVNLSHFNAFLLNAKVAYL